MLSEQKASCCFSSFVSVSLFCILLLNIPHICEIITIYEDITITWQQRILCKYSNAYIIPNIMLIVAILNFTFRNISRLFSIGLLALSTGANNNTTTDAAEYCKIPFDSHKHIDKYKTKEYVATERKFYIS